MPFNTWSVPYLGMEHAAPYLAAQQQLATTLGQQLSNQQTGIQNQYLPQSLQSSILQQQLANQKQQTLMPYVEPGAQAELQNALNVNKYYGPSAQAQIAAQNAAAKGTLANAALVNYQLQHPELLAGGQAAQFGAMTDLMKRNPGIFGAVGGSANAPTAAPGINQSAAQQQPNSILSSILNRVSGPQTQQVPFAANQSSPIMNAPGMASPNAMPSQGGIQIPSAIQPSNPLQQTTAPSMGNQVLRSMLAQMQAPEIKNELDKQRLQGAAFTQADTASKAYMTAQGTSFGMDPSMVNKQLLSGKTLADMAEEKGFGRNPANWPNPDFAPTTATRTRNQQRQTAFAELEPISNFMNESLGEYAGTIHNYSPAQVWDMANTKFGNVQKGTPEYDKLKNFITASMLSREYNAVRNNSMGLTHIGQGAMNDMAETAMNDFKIFRPLMNKDLYVDSQNLLNQKIKLMSTAANLSTNVPLGVAGEVTNNPYINQVNQQQSTQPGASVQPPSLGQMIKVQDKNGKIVAQGTEEQVASFLKDHPDHRRA